MRLDGIADEYAYVESLKDVRDRATYQYIYDLYDGTTAIRTGDYQRAEAAHRLAQEPRAEPDQPLTLREECGPAGIRRAAAAAEIPEQLARPDGQGAAATADLFPGTEYVGDVVLVNYGKTATTYKATTDNDDIQPVRKSGTIAAGKSLDLSFTVAPSVEGDIEGNITYTTDGGATATLHVKAFSHERPAYESIVTAGDFYFETAGDAPFLVTDTITGFPVAISTNAGDNTQSSMIVSFSVPEGQTGLVSWKAFGHGTQPNGPQIMLNGGIIISNLYNSSEDLYDVSSARVLTPGDYTLEFENVIGQDWYQKGFKKNPIELYVYDLSLVTMPTTDHAAHLIDTEADFGSQYVDKLSVMGLCGQCHDQDHGRRRHHSLQGYGSRAGRHAALQRGV